MIVRGIDKTWAADLVILSIIDVFSKYGWLVPLKNKKGPTVRDAFQVFKERVPEKLWTDKGTESICTLPGTRSRASSSAGIEL